MAYLREQGASDLAQVTLMSDGASVYACTSPDEVVDLLQGGQGVFGIALGRVWQEVEGTLADLPAERAAEPGAAEAGTGPDELARRRARRTGSSRRLARRRAVNPPPARPRPMDPGRYRRPLPRPAPPCPGLRR